MESTGTYWMTPYDALEQANLPISIVNPAHVKRMDGRKTDQEDARWLSQIAVNGSFIPSYIPSMEFRHLRMAARNLCKQIESLSDLKNRETKAFVVAGFRLNVFSDQFGKLATLAKNSLLEGKTGEEVVDILLSQKGSKRLKASKTELLEALSGKLTPELKGMIESNRRIYSVFEEEINKNKANLIDTVRQLEGENFELLQTIPGINDLSAAIILIEIGGSKNFLKAFSTGDNFAGWIGLCPGNNSSNNKRTGRKGRKGNKYLRRILCESAQAASRTKGSTLKSKYQSIKIRLWFKRSIVAIAHKSARLIFFCSTTPQRVH